MGFWDSVKSYSDTGIQYVSPAYSIYRWEQADDPGEGSVIYDQLKTNPGEVVGGGLERIMGSIGWFDKYKYVIFGVIVLIAFVVAAPNLLSAKKLLKG